MSENATLRNTCCLLDNSVQVDRFKMPSRAKRVDRSVQDYSVTVTTGIALVEFKATLIQGCISIHDSLRLTKSFCETRDAFLEATHRQSRLRAHIFNNLIQVFPEGEMNPQKDARLAKKACAKLSPLIPLLYDDFIGTVDSILNAEIICSRALERPEKKGVAFGVNLPNCVRGKNKTCAVEKFVRVKAPVILDGLKQHLAAINDENKKRQLERSISLFEDVISEPSKEFTVNDCRSAGDCLIAMEGASGGATHALSTNRTEWEPLCELLSMEFVAISYPEEQRLRAGRPVEKTE